MGCEAELEAIATQEENLIDQIGRTTNQGIRDKYELKLSKLADRRKEIEADRENGERELHKAQAALKSFTRWQTDLAALKQELQNGGVEMRLRLRSHLGELIDRIEVFAVGYLEEHDPSKVDRRRRHGESNADYWVRVHCRNGDPIRLADPTGDKDFDDFLETIAVRRMSKEGRFIRVHFKTGSVVNLVPPGSLADGSEMIKPKKNGSPWQPVRLDLQQLWKSRKRPTSPKG